MCGKHMVQKRGIEESDVQCREKETEMHFVQVGKGNRKYLRDVKVIRGELQQRLVVTNLVKKKLVRRETIERRKV